MTAADLIVLLAAAGTFAGIGWFFFGPRAAGRATLAAGVQEATVVVKGGYSPDVIRVQAGVPLRLHFDRQESGDCSAKVVFTDFALARSLPPTPPPPSSSCRASRAATASPAV